ncbi:MAG: GlsB/YeaQ/YmgE family stress response membrane protein [Actinomycetota bacterium]
MDDIGFWDIIVYAIAGLIIGALARLILPGKQSMSWGLTMVIGVVSAIIGGSCGTRSSRGTRASRGSAR